MSQSAAETSVPAVDDAEEGEIVDEDDDEEQENEPMDRQQSHSTTAAQPQSDSSKSTSSDKHKKSSGGTKSSSSTRTSSSKSTGKKRNKEPQHELGSDEAASVAKRGRDNENSDQDSADSGDSDADDEATKQRLMMQMMQIMLNASKKGRKSDRKTIELMDKMLKRGSDVSAKEVREVVRKNRRLLRSGSRDRRSRSRSRDRRSRSRRSDRRERSVSRDGDGSRSSRQKSPERLLATGPLVDPRTGVGLLKEKCKFFAEGKCLKGFDCPYSHEIILNKKREICKFYLQGYCGKGEHCFFMHEEFPCKFFHTGADCYSGDQCRFSHQALTEDGRAILRGYLDSGELPDDHLRNRQPEPASDELTNSGTVPEASTATVTPVVATAAPAATSYQPVKPVPKRHAILGDVTDEMRVSYYTWAWQQELKDLENAYTGNKRNLFCVEKQFVVSEKPVTPPPEDPDEAEFKVFSFYSDTMGDTDIRQLHPQPPMPMMSKDTDCRIRGQAAANDEDDLFLMSAAHDEDLRIPPSQFSDPVRNSESLQSGPVTDGPAIACQPEWQPALGPSVSSEQVSTCPPEVGDSTAGIACDSGGGDSPSAQSESKAKPKYDIAKMLNVIRQSTSQTAAATTPAVVQSEFWQNIFSANSLGSAALPATAASTSQASPSQVKDPRLKKESRAEDLSSALSKQDSSDLPPEDDDSEFRLMAITVPRIDYSTYVSMYRHDCKLKNDPRLQKFFTRSEPSDQLTQILPADTASRPLMSSSITQSTLMSLMTSNNRMTSSTAAANQTQDRDERLTPSSPPQLPSLPPLSLNHAPKAPILTIVPPPPPAMTPLELITSKPCPPPLSFHASLCGSDPGLNSKNGNGSAMDLSRKRDTDTEAEESITSPAITEEDTPASPASRRSSCDNILSPPLIQSAAAGQESSGDEKDEVPSALNPDGNKVLVTIESSASPFC